VRRVIRGAEKPADCCWAIIIDPGFNGIPKHGGGHSDDITGGGSEETLDSCKVGKWIHLQIYKRNTKECNRVPAY
jgi:hypothetical protein